jgi:hypothetical protein
MKSWLGVVGRACIEFVIILILISFAAGISASIPSQSEGIRVLGLNALAAALNLAPLAALLTLFLAFFAFELRIENRIFGLVGLLTLGIILFSAGIGLRRAPYLPELAAGAGETAQGLSLQSASSIHETGSTALWIGAYEGDVAVDAVSVDFGSDYPRLAYAARSPIDTANGSLDVQGRLCSAALPAAKPIELVPESEVFAGSWFWDRLAAMDAEPLYTPFVALGSFLLLALGCRFLCRITLWPLANAVLSAAGLFGIVVLDAVLSGPDFMGFASGLAARSGLFLPDSLLLAAIEGFIGIAACAIDLASAPRGRRRSDA